MAERGLNTADKGLVKNILKGELKRRGISDRELAERLGQVGAHKTERNLTNKISRGGFSAAFFVQCLDAAGVKAVRIGDE
jgi:hypothetical protein